MLNRVPIVRVFFASLLALTILAATLAPGTAQEATPSASTGEALPVGEPGQVGDYEITVLSVIPDAADAILEYNEFNSDPAPGTLFFMARLQVTYVGETSGSPWLELSLQSIGRNPEASYSEFESSCGDIPENGSLVSTELFTGGTIEYNVCWAIDQADVGTLVMTASSYAGNTEEGVLFSLGNESFATPESLASPEATAVALASTRSEPLPIGTASLVGSYSVQVVSVEPNATETTLGGPPAEGNQFFMVMVSVTNQGQEIGSPWFDLIYKSVGERSIGYTEERNTCGDDIPEGGMTVGDLAPGDTVEFNVCWQIPSTEAASVVMYVDPTYAMDKEGRTWFSLQP